MPTSRKSKVYTISLPPELAQKAEALARQDSRTMSELFREALRVYDAQRARLVLEDIGAYAAGRNPLGYSAADVSRLIKEVRSEKPSRRKLRVNE